MVKFKFKVKNNKNKLKTRKWSLKKKVTLKIKHPDKQIISEAKKKSRITRNNIAKLNNSQKRDLLINKGVLKHDSNAPDDLVNTMIDHLV